MLFSNAIFLLLFLPGVLFIYYVCLRGRNLRNVFLLFASLAFYAWGEPWFVLIMMLSICVNWLFALLVDKYRHTKRKVYLILTADILFNLILIFIFKYLTFTLTTINTVFKTSLSVPNIMLPIGISFFTFQAISYVIDVYRGHGEVQRSPLNVGLYIAFFPQLIAGPIVRYQTVADQIKNRTENMEDFSLGVCRFIVGLGKKILLSNTLAIVADKAFSSSELSMTLAWMGAIAYTLQIYFDFSGYSDMAIGLGKMFGFHFDENFNYPYISRSISEFWRRWHISLGTWFRDYVYFPLGGSRVKSNYRLVFNLFVVWFLTGVWHGANWTFIIWGLYFFIWIASEKLFAAKLSGKIPAVIKHLYVLLVVMIGWVLFRSPTITSAWAYILTLFGLNHGSLISTYDIQLLRENLLFFVFGILFSFPVANLSRIKLSRAKWFDALYITTFIMILIICLSYMVKGAYNPFIYFNF
ncbi:MAG: MBOAT family O-acyltransferase [Cellulosilyticaceae bacterium]